MVAKGQIFSTVNEMQPSIINPDELILSAFQMTLWSWVCQAYRPGILLTNILLLGLWGIHGNIRFKDERYS